MEDYAAGDLGPVYERATPLTLATVSSILQASSQSGGDAAMLARCREHVTLLEESTAPEHVADELRELRLRLRPAGSEANAHLAALLGQGDDMEEGIELQLGDAGDAEVGGGMPLKPFEVVALVTLVPKSAEEAMVIVPSLSRFDPEELAVKVIPLLDSGWSGVCQQYPNCCHPPSFYTLQMKWIHGNRLLFLQLSAALFFIPFYLDTIHTPDFEKRVPSDWINLNSAVQVVDAFFHSAKAIH
eukprot:gene889-518_t